MAVFEMNGNGSGGLKRVTGSFTWTDASMTLTVSGLSDIKFIYFDDTISTYEVMAFVDDDDTMHFTWDDRARYPAVNVISAINGNVISMSGGRGRVFDYIAFGN